MLHNILFEQLEKLMMLMIVTTYNLDHPMLSSLSRSSTIQKRSVLVLRIWDHNCTIEKYVEEHGLQTDGDADDVVDDCYNV